MCQFIFYSLKLVNKNLSVRYFRNPLFKKISVKKSLQIENCMPHFLLTGKSSEYHEFNGEMEELVNIAWIPDMKLEE